MSPATFRIVWILSSVFPVDKYVWRKLALIVVTFWISGHDSSCSFNIIEGAGVAQSV
jgi:hypothetical protein